MQLGRIACPTGVLVADGSGMLAMLSPRLFFDTAGFQSLRVTATLAERLAMETAMGYETDVAVYSRHQCRPRAISSNEDASFSRDFGNLGHEIKPPEE